MRFYIADCHFGHDKARILDHRPFGSVEEMDEVMIERWNQVVTKKKDEVVILGDFSVEKGERTNALLRRLNGKKYLITGNHDRMFLRDKKFDTSLFQWIKPYGEMRDNGRKLVLCHYPILCYNGQYHGDTTYMLYGHVHNTKDYENVEHARRESWKIQYKERGPGGVEGATRSLSCNLLNCFTMFGEFRPLTLDQWIQIDQERSLDGV